MTRKNEIFNTLYVDQALSRPDLGPRILFFSGGSALKEISQALIHYTHHSVHLVTPFDSGGSSAALRNYFAMPAVGDLRSRLMALADRTQPGVAELYDLLAYRLPVHTQPAERYAELCALARGTHALMLRIARPERVQVCRLVQGFAQAIGRDFDLRGASVGNMILTAGYLERQRIFGPVVSMFSSLVHVRGAVELVVNCDLHLRAVLCNNEEVIGQHCITGKERAPLTVPIRDMHLIHLAQPRVPVWPHIDQSIAYTISNADLICYPVGSLYSSVLANILPVGVAQAISSATCPKVFIPNPIPDPESIGLSLLDQARVLLRYLRIHGLKNMPVSDVLHYVLLDDRVMYPGVYDLKKELAGLGIQVIVTSLVDTASGKLDPEALCRVLVSLSGHGSCPSGFF